MEEFKNNKEGKIDELKVQQLSAHSLPFFFLMPLHNHHRSHDLPF